MCLKCVSLCFLEKCRLHFFVAPLALIKAGEYFRIFKKTAEKKFIEFACMKNMHIPAWTSGESGTVMFLP